MIVKLKNVLPNPFRDMERYPIHPQKIALLKKSIESTDFWENVVARPSKEQAGKIELAYGHHRITALRELNDPETEFNWIVRDLDDTSMLKIMADENAAEWGSASNIERETIRAIVGAYAENRIALHKPLGRENQWRQAPLFCLKLASAADASPYTADTIVSFLDGTMTTPTVKYTLRALCLIDQGHIKEKQLDGLSTNQCKTVVDEVSKTLKEADKIRKEAETDAMTATPEREIAIKQHAEEKASQLVAEIARGVSEAVKGGTKAAKEAGREVRAASKEEDAEIPEINEAAKSVTHALHRLLDKTQHPASKLEEMVKFKKHLSPTTKQNLICGLEETIKYANGYIARLKW